MTILTISRQMGSLGDDIAQALAQRLGWKLINRKSLLELFLQDVTNDHERHMLTESAKYYLNPCGKQGTYLDFIIKSLKVFSQQQNVVLVGFGSQVIFADSENAIHLRIVAPEDIRLARIRKQYSLGEGNARKVLATADRKHKRFVSTLFQTDLTETTLYDLVFNTAQLGVDDCVNAVLAMVRAKEVQEQLEAETADTEAVMNIEERSFKNPSEIEFAKILDMYHIEWTYEPKTFPIEWDAEGNVTLAFSPDFYLPQFDTYIELTTMNQRYVTEKNRKVKKIQALYPGTNIRIVYKKDFQSLVERFNLAGRD